MKIQNISATNFRALKSIALVKASDVNVIVGPNAIGKSTLLEAIRLTKTILAPRFVNEGQQVLVQLGALSPHNQAIGGPGIDVQSLANDPNKDVVIEINFELSDSDVSTLRGLQGPLAMVLLQNERGSNEFNGPLAFTQFLSTPAGQKRISEIMADVGKRLSNIAGGTSANLTLTMDPRQTIIRGGDEFDQAIVSLLDRILPNQLTTISLFPADRAFPQGEQQLQLGSGDAQQQLMSHMALPSTKYARLKQTIIHNTLLDRDGRGHLESEFNLIFDNLLPGKKLAGVSFNQLGLLKVLVQDQETGKTFDIDQMSSGEKGLLLTFLFLRLSVKEGGIVLMDEPELHLNSAVQSKIMTFLLEHCIRPKSLQVFICTHSPEIVRDAFDGEGCNLYHLRSGDDLTPVLRQDQQELFEIFGRLGSSAADVFFTRGNVYVEGPHDNYILQAGYSEILAGYKVTAVGGRGEIEREAPELQAQEALGKLRKRQLFILDGDRKPTRLKSTELVRIHQLKRYCLENYLLEDNLLFDLISSHARKPIDSRGIFPSVLKELALSQTTQVAIWETYLAWDLEPVGLRREEFISATVDDVAQKLSENLAQAKIKLSDFDSKKWASEFADACRSRDEALRQEWAVTWREVCDGKSLIDALYIKYEISMKKIEFKKEIMKKMAVEKTDDWRIMNEILTSELGLLRQQ